MSTNEQHYLICNLCGDSYHIDGRTVMGETPDCVRAEAEDDGWKCYLGSNNTQDYCLCCRPIMEPLHDNI